jgi:hypothetical protein
MAEGAIEFYPLFRNAKVVEVISENYVTIHWYGMNMIYSVKDQKFNATKLVEAISNTKFKKWNETQIAAQFRERYPEFFIEKTKVANRLKGTYLDPEMIYVIVAWANPMIGFHLTNGRAEEYGMTDKSGFIYLVQPEEYLGTNIFKVGRTWKLEHRLPKYGKNTKIIKTAKVKDMYSVETKLLNSLKDETISDALLVKGSEYFECELESIEYHFDEAVKEYGCEN